MPGVRTVVFVFKPNGFLLIAIAGGSHQAFGRHQIVHCIRIALPPGAGRDSFEIARVEDESRVRKPLIHEREIVGELALFERTRHVPNLLETSNLGPRWNFQNMPSKGGHHFVRQHLRFGQFDPEPWRGGTLPRPKPVKFISGIRDPIERAVSGLFESAESAKSSLEIGELKELVDSGAESLGRFVTDIVDPVLRWFDHRYFCDLDVYGQSFNASKGYDLVEGAAASVFLYRVDKLSSCWAPLSDYVGLPLKPTSTNESEKKEYSSLYKAALSKVKFSRDFMEYVVGSRYCQTFFDERERKAMEARYLI